MNIYAYCVGYQRGSDVKILHGASCASTEIEVRGIVDQRATELFPGCEGWVRNSDILLLMIPRDWIDKVAQEQVAP